MTTVLVKVQRSGELGLFSSMSSRLFGDKQTGSFNYQVAAKSDLYLSVVIGVYFYPKMNPDNSRATNLESPRLTSKGQMLGQIPVVCIFFGLVALYRSTIQLNCGNCRVLSEELHRLRSHALSLRCSRNAITFHVPL